MRAERIQRSVKTGGMVRLEGKRMVRHSVGEWAKHEKPCKHGYQHCLPCALAVYVGMLVRQEVHRLDWPGGAPFVFELPRRDMLELRFTRGDGSYCQRFVCSDYLKEYFRQSLPGYLGALVLGVHRAAVENCGQVLQPKAERAKRAEPTVYLVKLAYDEHVADLESLKEADGLFIGDLHEHIKDEALEFEWPAGVRISINPLPDHAGFAITAVGQTWRMETAPVSYLGLRASYAHLLREPLADLHERVTTLCAEAE